MARSWYAFIGDDPTEITSYFKLQLNTVAFAATKFAQFMQ